MTENPFGAGAGSPDMNALLQQAQQMQQQLSRPSSGSPSDRSTARRAVAGHRHRHRHRRAGGRHDRAGGFDGGRPRRPVRPRRPGGRRLPRRLAPSRALPRRPSVRWPSRCSAAGFPACRLATADSGLYEGVVQDLIDELGRLPGVGPKSAQRIAFHLLAGEPTDVRRLADVLIEVKAKVKFCSTVRQRRRGRAVPDLPRPAARPDRAVRRRGAQGRRRHRAHPRVPWPLPRARRLDLPIDGIGPDELRIRELLPRLADGVVTEIILATDPNLEGEATATYLTRLLVPLGLRVTRLASGLPVGGDLEYADEVTLGRAFAGRRCSAMTDQ